PFRDPEHLTAAGVPIDARFQVLAGVQLYFDRSIAFEHGHIYFGESPWGLMGMSQIQHWRNWQPVATGVRGNLSLVLGAWRAETSGLGDFAVRRLIHAAQKVHPLSGSVRCMPEEARPPWGSPGAYARDDLADAVRKQVAWCRGTDAQFRRRLDLHVPPAR